MKTDARNKSFLKIKPVTAACEEHETFGSQVQYYKIVHGTAAVSPSILRSPQESKSI